MAPRKGEYKGVNGWYPCRHSGCLEPCHGVSNRVIHEATCYYRPGGLLGPSSARNAGARPVAATRPIAQPQAGTSDATPALPAATLNAVQATPTAPTVPTITPQQVAIPWTPCRYCTLKCGGETNGETNLAIHEAQCLYRPGGTLYNAGVRVVATTGPRVQPQAVTSNATPALTSTATPAAPTVPAIPPQQVMYRSASSTSSAQVHSGSGKAHANQTSSAPNTQAPPSAAMASTVRPPAVTSNAVPAVPTAPSIPPQQIALPSASSASSVVVRTTFACAATEALHT